MYSTGVHTLVVLWLLFGVSLAGCGAVGPPIPPEELGVAKLLEEQERKEAQDEPGKEEKAQPEALEEPAQEKGFNLPPLRPIGGQ